MGNYKDRRNYVDHDFNTTTITVNGSHKIEGVELLEVELDEDETTVAKAGDGIGIFQKNPSRSGQIRVTFLEASASNDIMWNLRKDDTSFKVSILDSAAPNLDCHGNYCRIMKPPVVHRSLEHNMVEWIITCVYLDVKGGSYSLAAA